MIRRAAASQFITLALAAFGAAAWWFASATGCSSAVGPPVSQSGIEAESDPFIEEILANIRSQPVGALTVAEYDLPEEFLRRAADRILISSFEDEFRIVVLTDGEAATHHDLIGNRAPVLTDPLPNSKLPQWMRIVDRDVAADVRAYRKTLVEGFPPLPGFRASISEKETWPYNLPASDSPAEILAAADIVGRRLSRDGLLLTLAQAIESIGPERFSAEHSDEVINRLLRTVGLPVDLLAHFGRSQGNSGVKLVRWIASQIAEGKDAKVLQEELQQIAFEFQQAMPGFKVSTESGEMAPTMIRCQFSRGDYWDGRGDGGNVDLVRQVIDAFPNVNVVASINRAHLPALSEVVTSEEWQHAGRFELIVADHSVSQWAQDNGKAGTIDGQAATLAPRYASRGEVGSVFIPGESFIIHSVAAGGHRVAQSPLLFQGGNLLAVSMPSTQQRLLLIGEAEVHRNRVLGLTEEQILHAYGIEFGVDRCEVIENVAFHIDFDLTVRSQGDRVLAFVEDSRAGAHRVLDVAIGMLRPKELLDESEAAATREHLKNGDWRAVLSSLGAVIGGQAVGPGRFPAAFADLFSTGPTDSGIGNLQRVLLGLDTVRSVTMSPAEWDADEALRAYLGALARRAKAEESLHRRLKELGFEIIPIPGLPGGKRGISALNGIHMPDSYVMPAYGGLFSTLDDAARSAFHAALGDSCRVMPVLTGESQRRSGAVHCSIVVMEGRAVQ